MFKNITATVATPAKTATIFPYAFSTLTQHTNISIAANINKTTDFLEKSKALKMLDEYE